MHNRLMCHEACWCSTRLQLVLTKTAFGFASAALGSFRGGIHHRLIDHDPEPAIVLMNLGDGTPQSPLASATVLMLRDGPGGLEVFLVRRHGLSDVLGGAFVFPG